MYLSRAFGVMYSMKECPYCIAENQEAAIVCWSCGRALQAPKADEKSAWKLSATGAIGLTFLSTCGIAVHIDNEFDAIRSLVFDLPITFLLWWLVCTFLVWVWRTAAVAINSIRQSAVAQWLKSLLS
jgi:hypothetical protein